MLRGLSLLFLLSGCTLVQHVQVLPIVDFTDFSNYDVNCCVMYVEIPPSTRASLSVTKDESGVKVKASAKWKF